MLVKTGGLVDPVAPYSVAVLLPLSLQGLMWGAAYEECPQAEYTGIALEYGTLPIMSMIGALRADQWLENHPDTPAAQRAQIKRQTRDAFYIDTDEWKRQIIAQAVDAAHGAIRGLARR